MEQNKEENKGCNCKKLGYFSENCEVHKSLGTLVPHSHLDSLPPQEQPKECGHGGGEFCSKCCIGAEFYPSQPNEQWERTERIDNKGTDNCKPIVNQDWKDDAIYNFQSGFEKGATSRDSEWRKAIEEETPKHVTREYRDTDAMRDRILKKMSNPQG